MKIPIGSIELEVGDWSPKLGVVALIAAVVAMCSAVLTLFFHLTIPGLSPLALGITLLLLGVKSFHEGVGEKRKALMALGAVQTLLFVLCLCLGISQIVDALSRAIGLMHP